MITNIPNDPVLQYLEMKKACKSGDLNTLKYFEERGMDLCFDNNILVRLSVTGNHLEIMKYLIEKNPYKDMRKLLRTSAREGAMDVFKYLYETGVEDKENITFFYAVVRSQKEIIQYYIDNGFDITIEGNKALKYSFEDGNLDMIRFLIDNGAKLNEKMISACASILNKDILEYLFIEKKYDPLPILSEKISEEVRDWLLVVKAHQDLKEKLDKENKNNITETVKLKI